MTIQQLILDLKVTYIHNTKAPPGTYIEFRRKGGTLVEFVTYFSNGNSNTQLANDRSSLLNHDGDTWLEVKDLASFKAKGKVFAADNAKSRGGVNINSLNPPTARGEFVCSIAKKVSTNSQLPTAPRGESVQPSDKPNIHGIITPTPITAGVVAVVPPIPEPLVKGALVGATIIPLAPSVTRDNNAKAVDKLAGILPPLK